MGVNGLMERVLNDLKDAKVNIDPDCFINIIEINKLELVKLAVEKGAKINENSKEMDTSPLEATHLSTREGKEIFKWLVEQGADLNNASFDHIVSNSGILN